MRVLGIDFTSSPNRRKPITCLFCVLPDGMFSASTADLQELHNWDAFEDALSAPRLHRYTTRRRRLSSITRAPCRKVMGVPGQRWQAAR